MTAITTNARNLVLLLAILVLASACTVRFNTDVTLSEDDTATVNIVFGIRLEGEFPTEGAEGMEELDPEDSEADLQALSGQCGFDAGAVEAVEYNEDEFMGVEITLTDIPISAVNCFLGEDEDSPFEEFSITRDGDNYVFNGTAPPLGEAINDPSLGGQKRQVAQEEIEVPEIPSEALEGIEELGSEFEDLGSELEQELGEDLEELGDDLDQQFEDAFGGAAPEIEAEVRITFPGGVGDNNADRVEGNTAIWELNLEEPTTMMAVGAAGGGDNLLLFIIIGLVVVLLLVLIGVLVARSRSKSQQPAFGGPPGAGPQGGGFAGPPGAAPPPGGAPQQPGGFGGPPGGGQPQPPPQQQPGGFGGPPGGGQPQPPQQQPGGFGGPPGGGQPQPPPQQPQPPQPQPEQPQQPPQPEQGGDAGSGGGFDPGSTRTFRPEDLLPPEEQGGDNR